MRWSLTADAIVGGVHFFPDDPPDAIAQKALRVNLSDLAAKGAKPAGFLLTLALPKGCRRRLAEGFRARARRGREEIRLSAARRRHGLHAGPGDDLDHGVRHGAGRHHGARSGARAGDHVVVTGTIGDAALGLKLRKERGAAKRWKLDAAMQRHLLARYLVPEPRNALAEALRRNASAAMDVSDGLAGDLGKLCRASGVGAEIDVARVPLSKAARAVLAADPKAIETILTGGDDFEVVATDSAAASSTRSWRPRARAGVPVTDIGRVTAGQGRPVPRAGRPAAPLRARLIQPFLSAPSAL